MAAGLAIGLTVVVLAAAIALPALALAEWASRRRTARVVVVHDELTEQLEADIHWAGVEASWREFLAGLPVLEEWSS